MRNSLDHGIELPENRIAAGKSPVGNLILPAEHQGGNICIEVTDDGAGLNCERIPAKAISQGMAVNENMTDEEVGMLIFAPGFSTAEQVTDVSGRGVGMDVVKRNIRRWAATLRFSQTGFRHDHSHPAAADAGDPRRHVSQSSGRSLYPPAERRDGIPPAA